jgi:XRE family transcriptional regulator, aerobic/anaerobic benzoate catabolism transcriptional regulator
MVDDPRAARLLQAIGSRVRTRRLDRAMTVQTLAKGSGLSRRFLADLEAGRANVSVVNLARIARALSTSLATLLDEPGARTVALLGLRGAGKSTVGAALARKLALPFVELDALVEGAAGLPVAEIFAVHGETHFRRLEARVLEEFLASARPSVLATGGGLVGSRETFELLRRGSFTVWLRARPEDHMERVVRQGDRRPIARSGRAAAMAQLRQILAAREPLYDQADLAVDTSALTPREVVVAIEDELRRRGEAA